MNMLEKSTIKNKIIHDVLKEKKLFNRFKNVYLFGSILNNENHLNDVDILLIYSKFNVVINKDAEKIKKHFYETYNLIIDLTILNINELKETKFLEKIKCYNKII